MIIMSRAWPKDTRQLTRNQRKKRKLLRSQLTLEGALLNYQKQEVVGVIGAPRWPPRMNIYVCISKALESDNLPLFIVSRNRHLPAGEGTERRVPSVWRTQLKSDNHFCLSSVERKHLPEGDRERNGTLCSTSLPNDGSRGNICVACNHVTQRCRKLPVPEI